jgi:hypothetical protein
MGLRHEVSSLNSTAGTEKSLGGWLEQISVCRLLLPWQQKGHAPERNGQVPKYGSVPAQTR